MNRSSDNVNTPAHNNRRALILQHDPALLSDPDVVAFLDDKVVDWMGNSSLEHKFVLANEPALLMELARVSRCAWMRLTLDIGGTATAHSLHAGFFDHVLQHLSEVPWLTNLKVEGADLTAKSCALLQTALLAPGCGLTSLSFSNCSLVGVQVQFPLHAPTVREFNWVNLYDAPPPVAELTQLMPSLTGWSNLGLVRLLSLGAPFNFGVLAQLLQANRCIKNLFLASDEVPSQTGHPAPDAQLDPALLLTAIKHNRTAVSDMTLRLTDPDDLHFDDQLLQLVADCLSVNTTLESLNIPGITMCSDAALQQFNDDLWNNHTLIALEPHNPFGQQPPAPIQRNQHWHFRLTPEFVVGAAEAFMRLMGTPGDIGKLVGNHLASTSVDRIYCGPVMALLCKATQEGAVRLRSGCLRDALIKYMTVNDASSCRNLLATMARVHVDLLAADKAAVVHHARTRRRLNCLPAGYAG